MQFVVMKYDDAQFYFNTLGNGFTLIKRNYLFKKQFNTLKTKKKYYLLSDRFICYARINNLY